MGTIVHFYAVGMTGFLVPTYGYGEVVLTGGATLRPGR